MLLQSFVSLCMKITNSVVGVGLYYGFLTTFSIRPAYLFLFVEEPEQKAAAITGLLMGQLVRFMAIYNRTLHLLLWAPHTVTALFLPYLFLYFTIDNWDYTITTFTRSNFLIFLNTFIFQLANQILLPSTLARLVNVYMFRCNNKMLFVTSSFIGWLIGQICFLLFTKRLFDWIRIYLLSSSKKELVSALDKYTYKYLGAKFQVRFSYFQYRVSELNKYMKSELNKYKKKIYQYLVRSLGEEFEFLMRTFQWIVSEIQYLLLINLRRNTGRFVNIFLFVTCAYYLGRIPVFIFPHPLTLAQAPKLIPFWEVNQIRDAATFWKDKDEYEDKEKENERDADEEKNEEIVRKKVLVKKKFRKKAWGSDLYEKKDQKSYRGMDGGFAEDFSTFAWTRPGRYIGNEHFFAAKPNLKSKLAQFATWYAKSMLMLVSLRRDKNDVASQ